MTRFEIQDIVSQNQDGVTFRALDKSTNQIVSLRRFFPFGQCDEDEEGGEGLDPQEGKAFSSACERLSRINHPALRRTIFGDTDPVDGMPFLVTEWLEGESLADVLGNNTMEPSMIIGLVRQALDVCITLSNTLKNEAVWIDAKLEAIIVGNATELPTFSFRICPFKWLGTQSHQKDLTGIVSMVEALMGWKTKLVSDQAGLGLGGWLKLLRQNPQMELKQALQTLPDPAVVITPLQTEGVYSKSTPQPYILESANPSLFTKKSISIMAASACLTAALIFFLYQQNVRNADSSKATITDDSAIVEQPPEILEVTPIPTPIPTPTPTPTPATETTPLKITTWSPVKIPTAAWYDASHTATITSTNGSVFQWNDISGNNAHATQSTSDLQPKTGTRTINDLNAIDFDIDKLDRTEINMNGKAIFAVMSLDQGGDGGLIFSHSNINNQLRMHSRGQVGYAASPTRYKDFRPSTQSLTMDKPGMVGFILNTTLQYSVNGVFDDTGVSETTSVGAAFNQFGAREENAVALDGLVGEIIITESVPDTDTRQKIEGYLAHKWRITENLPADHPYKLSPPDASASEVIIHKDPDPKETEPKELEPVKQTPTQQFPFDIPVTAWYDASTATIKDDMVSIVNAASSGGVISGPASLVANGIGNIQTVQFNGTNQYLTGNYTNTGDTLTAFYVGKSLNTNQTEYAGMMSIWANNQIHDYNNISNAVLFFQNKKIQNSIYTHRNAILSSATAPLTTGFLAATVFDGSTNTLYLNGTPSAAVPSANNFNTNNIILGGRWHTGATSLYWNGNFGEVIICNSNLSTSDRQKIEGYLAHKWGLTGNLPADHPHKSAPPTNATPSEMTTHKAAVIVTKVFSATPLTYSADVSNSDLLTGLTPVTTGWHTINNASTLELTDGIHGLGSKEVAGDMVQGAFTTVGATAIYNLGTGANGLGYDIASMQSIADWRDSGFGNQAWTVAVKLVGGSDFVDLTTVDYQPLGASDGGTTKVTLTDASGVLAKGVESIKITANGIAEGSKNKIFVWRELDVFGTPSSATPIVIDVLTPQNTDYIKTLKVGEPVTLQGIVKSAKFSSTGKSIYLSFSDPVVETDIRVVIHGSEYIGNDFTEEEFAKLIDKHLVFSGTVYTESFNDRPPFVKITEKNQIKLATADLLKKISTTAKPPETISEIPTFSPDDFEAIAKLELKKPAAVKGIVKSVKIPKPGMGLYIAFSDPHDGKQIRVAAYPKSFEGKTHTDIEFAKLEKDLQRLVGKSVIFEGKVITQGDLTKPHFILINALDQIKETK